MKYDELTIPEFVLGYTQAARKETKSTQKHMRDHLEEMMEDAMDFQWTNVRHANGVWLNTLEQGLATWSDRKERKRIRAKFAQTGEIARGELEKSYKRYCYPYQMGTCSHKADHDTPRGKVHHICANCWRISGIAETHPDTECTKHPKNG